MMKYLMKIARMVAHKGEHVFHITYLGLVGWEGEHMYKYAAIGLLICIVINAVEGDM